MRKYNPTNSKVSVDERGRVSFTMQPIQEARITIHKSMFDFMNKEIKQLMKKHDAYVNKGESDKTYTVISTPSASFEKDYSSLMKKHKKKIIQHFKIEDVQEDKEYIDEAKYTNVHNKIKGIENLSRKDANNIANIDPAVLSKVVKALAPMMFRSVTMGPSKLRLS